MSLGNKILELRKKYHLSQENLAEKINVTRQTISKWELDETAPDIKQAKELSKLFNISLDELTDNDTQNILVEKISNTEKLAGMVIKILKFIGVAFLALLIVDIISLILFSFSGNNISKLTSETTAELTCRLNGQEYHYQIKYDEDNNIISTEGDKYIEDNINVDEYFNQSDLIEDIENYFVTNNGKCY